ncbi:MAG: hypothetical protein FJW88_12010 [Actinobacteria bacterium]|nr:hypothetical protein [Actinomycetota bacterium]
MRDPGTPRRNPFFEYADPDESGSGEQGETPDAGSHVGANAAGGLLGALGELVDALVDAQPEASEHLVAAAHEMVLAVKTVVDATEVALAAQRAAMTASPSTRAARAHAPDVSPAGPETATGSAPVRRLDLA